MKTDPVFREKTKKRNAEYQRDREAHCAYRAEYYRKNQDSIKRKTRAYGKANALRLRLAEKGATLEQYHALVARQGGRCGVCGGPPGRGRSTYNIDHDHKTGQLRGLLCHNCNVGLGHFKDNPELLHRAAEYLHQSLS